MISHSQYGEDVLIAGLFGGRVGRLLEIGAWDPMVFSNSRLLIERDWEAILVEPSPGPLQALLREYGHNEKVKVLGAMITPNDANVLQLHITDDAVSTSTREVFDLWKDQVAYYGTLWTPGIPIATLFHQFGGDFDFISIDAEGTSVDLAIASFAAGAVPNVMCVEHDGRIIELQQEAQQHGFKTVHTNGTNIILAR